MLKPPTILQLEVTKNCNLACIMCHKGQVEPGKDFDRTDITDEVIRGVRPVYPYLRHAMLFGDGEPMVYRGFWDIVKEICAASPRCCIDFINNGTMMHEANIDRCIKHNISHMGLSLGGASFATHDYIRKGSSFSQIIENFKLLRDKKKKLGRQQPYVTALIVVMRSNYKELPEFVDMCADLDFFRIELQQLFVTHPSMKEEVVSSREVEPYFRLAGGESRRRSIDFFHYSLESGHSYTNNVMSNYYDDPFFQSHYDVIPDAGYCKFQQPWNTIYVLHDGAVVPDCHWWASVKNTNLNNCGKIDKDTNIIDIWNGSKYRAIRSHIRGLDILPQCRGCGLAGGILDHFRSQETDHIYPDQERNLVQVSISKESLADSIDDPDVKNWFLKQQKIKEDKHVLQSVDNSRSNDLSKHKNNLFYIATTGLGEMVCQTPIMRTMNSRYNIYLLIREILSDAFRGAPFLESVIGCGELDLQYDATSISISNEFIDLINSLDADVMTPLHFASCGIKGSIFDMDRTFEEYRAKTRFSTDGYARNCGVNLDSYKMYAAPGNKFVTMKGVNLGLCIGSNEVYRRIPYKTFERLAKYFSSKYNVYLLGRGFHKEVSNTISLMDCSLLDMLGCISNLDIIVTPDTGVLHLAIARNIKTVAVQSRECMENLISSFYWKNVKHYAVHSSKLSCAKDCRARIIEANIGDVNRPYDKWDEKIPHIPSSYPQSLSCDKSVDCLKYLDPEEIDELIMELL